MKTRISMSALVCALSLISFSTVAAVAPEEAAKLGTILTPTGAEKAGSDNIPSWEGGLPPNAGSADAKGFLSDPFASEQPLFVITAKNAQQYKDHLTPGQLALFARYPDSYRMPVFPSHRSVALPAAWVVATKNNATTVKLAKDGIGLENYSSGIPFPIPQSGLEVIWNHLSHYIGSVHRRYIQATPQANGAYTPVQFEDEILPFYKLRDPGNLLFLLKQRVLAPSRLAGNVLLIHETLNQVDNPRQAWQYNAGQRRVRRAPQVAYDGPGTAADGMRTSDNFDMFNGAPDRYDWQLNGKKEIYIPYNSYKLDSPNLKYNDIIKPGHLNPDFTRYELHRVWHVTATLKAGARHIYAKRDFFIDEDSWLIATVDHYDGRGTLWRVAEAYPQYFYHKQFSWFTAEALYDLQSGRYLVLGLKNEEKQAWEFDYQAQENSFTPAALRQSGVR